ncbi:lysylphosphatidylglycerol synthase transmembrane domain-containing protein [Thermodesulfobacteriota bacterium]
MLKFLWKYKLRLLGPLAFGYIVYRIDLEKLFACLRQAEIHVYLLALPLVWISIFCKSLRWRQLIVGGPVRDSARKIEASFFQSFLVYFGAMFWGAATPGRVGELYKTKYVQEQGGSFGQALASAVMDRLFDVAGLLLFALLFFGRLVDRLTLDMRAVGVAILVGFALLAGGGLLIAFPMLLWPLGGTQHSEGSVNKKGGLLWKLGTAHAEIRRWRPTVWIFCLVSTCVALAPFLLQRYSIAIALDIHVDFVTYSAVIALSGLLCLLPITVQGIGTRDAVLVLCLGWEGVPPERALAVSSLILMTMLINMTFGFIAFLASKGPPQHAGCVKAKDIPDASRQLR